MALFRPLPIVGIDPVILPAQASASVQSLTGSAETHYFNTTIFDVPYGDFPYVCSPQLKPRGTRTRTDFKEPAGRTERILIFLDG